MPRGGMCKLPFGGNPSMSELDEEFMASLEKGELTVGQTLCLRIIKMSVRDYLYFGLGENHITPERFLEAYAYLFKSRANDPTTWGYRGVKERYRNLAGELEKHTSTLTPETIKTKCFDFHYENSGLENNLTLRRFLTGLLQRREAIINENKRAVLQYMVVFRNTEWRKHVGSSRGKHAFPRKNFVHTLVRPDKPKELAKLFLYGRSKRKNKPIAKKIPRVSTLDTLTHKSLTYKTLLF